jgi:heme/copper-type cytochrome/quinol oxidase subunit 3
LFRWFSDIVVESTFEGNHTFKVQEGVRLGMFLFIVSEMMFVWVRKLRRINYEFYIHNSSTY